MTKNLCYTETNLYIIDIQVSYFFFTDLCNLRTIFLVFVRFPKGSVLRKSCTNTIISGIGHFIKKYVQENKEGVCLLSGNGIIMRNKQKQEILGILHTLDTAHGAVKDAADKGNVQGACDILAECQQAAVAVGTSIERSEGEGHMAVARLEEYCETLYSIYEALESGDCSPNKTYKVLHKQLIKIENTVKNDVNVRKEAVFFPYKASMWDSLESVYLALKEDPEYDVYCVPIPYYELNPDHSFGEMHYEGDQYPGSIEVTDWQKYYFEGRMPDEIYIHNGYDNCNLVTSVHPRFYASNLKKYTDMLVYIPYFVLGDIDPDNQAAINGMKHFVWMPGVIYADKVIVQSEKMKQIYVNEYLKAAKESGLNGNHLNRKYLEQKISGAGSPKLDRVQKIRKEDLDIPPDWEKIIQKPDGTDKKVIFYNTSISALLQNDTKMLEKMERALEIFKEHKDDVALLWRPHPLIPATIRAMRPQLWKRYCAIVDKYRQEDWGIYDDSADIDRAVILSDAYYGDGSSVVQLCRKRGMPVMIQNVDV